MWEGVGMRTGGREGWMVKKGGEREGRSEGRSEGRRVGGRREVRRQEGRTVGTRAKPGNGFLERLPPDGVTSFKSRGE